jgi:N-acetyl-anhydromuramoyl-L-alanine amidase
MQSDYNVLMYEVPLILNEEQHLLQAVPYEASPHCDARPASIAIDTVIIHGISLPPGEFGSNVINHFFCGKLDFGAYPALDWLRELRVSAHVLIKRSGEMVQFVPFNKRAWHAGVSQFAGRTHCNDFSIGIELEGTDSTPYEMVQYVRLGALVRLLMQHYANIKQERIVGHSDVAPGRKTDPGPHFNWDVFRGLIT